MMPDPHDPDRCRRDCWKMHKMRTLALMDMELAGEKLMRAIIQEIRSFHECLGNCIEEHIPVEPYRKAPQASPYPQPYPSPQPTLPYELLQYLYELSSHPYGWPSHPLLHIVELQPDYNEFAHLHNSAIWVTFDQPVKASTVTEETFAVYDEASEMRVDGTRTIANNGKTVVFWPNGDYPGCDAPNGTNIIVRLVGTDVGLGAIESEWGVALDGDENGSPGGDLVTVYAILG